MAVLAEGLKSVFARSEGTSREGMHDMLALLYHPGQLSKRQCCVLYQGLLYG